MFPNIRKLDLSYTELDNDGIALISATLPQLRELDIAGTEITDECVPDLIKLESLKLLIVTDTAISEEALAVLDGIEGCEVFPLKFHRPEAVKNRAERLRRRSNRSPAGESVAVPPMK